ncbi:MAG: hypothetical protein ACFFD2_16520 [Promethearchaeota archaeon]
MKYNKKILIATSLFIAIFYCLPFVIGSTTMPLAIAPYSYLTVPMVPGGLKSMKITYSADASIDAFVTDDTADITSYVSTGNIPSGVLVSHIGLSGSLCVTYSDPEGMYYLVLGNIGGLMPVSGTYTLDPNGCGIPGFEILIVFFALLATFGILWSKKKLNF